MKIAIDLDDVLGDFVPEFLKWRNFTYGSKLRFNDFTEYHWANMIGVSSSEAVGEVRQFYRTEEFANLPALTGAKEAIGELAKHHELYIVTARMFEVEDITRQWLDRMFPKLFKDILFTNQYGPEGGGVRDKGKMCKRLGCSVLIDDNTYHLDSLSANGIRLIVLNKPWNVYHRLPPSIHRADNWEEIVETINKMAKQNV